MDWTSSKGYRIFHHQSPHILRLLVNVLVMSQTVLYLFSSFCSTREVARLFNAIVSAYVWYTKLEQVITPEQIDTTRGADVAL